MSTPVFTPHRIATHLLVLLAGGGLAWASYHQGADSADDPSTGPPHLTSSTSPGSAEIDASRKDRTPVERNTTRGRSEACREAWKLLLERKLPAAEKRRLQMKLLAEWAEVDLDAALEMAADTPPMGDDEALGGSLFAAFRAKMRKDPELFWPAIHEGRFGLVTGDLRRIWAELLAHDNPELLLSHLDDLPTISRAKIVAMCLDQLDAKPDEKLRLAMRLADLPDTPENRMLWKAAGRTVADQPIEDLIEQAGTATREGERRLLLEGLALKLGESKDNRAAIGAQFNQLPDSMKRDTALSLIRESRSGEPATVGTDYLLAHEDWESINKVAAIRIHELSFKNKDTTLMVDWALDLPERTETEDLYRTALRGYLSREPAEAKKWLMELPPGWKRDNALSGYVQDSLNARGDAATATWARGQIQSPHFKQRADGLISSWQSKKQR